MFTLRFQYKELVVKPPPINNTHVRQKAPSGEGARERKRRPTGDSLHFQDLTTAGWQSKPFAFQQDDHSARPGPGGPQDPRTVREEPGRLHKRLALDLVIFP